MEWGWTIVSEQMCDLREIYVLGGLAEKEKQAFEVHLRTCTDCQEEVADLHKVANELLFDFAEVSPPAGMRNRVLDAIFAAPQEVSQISEDERRASRSLQTSELNAPIALAENSPLTEVHSVRIPLNRPPRRGLWLPWLSAAVLFLVVTGASLYWTMNRTVSPLGRVTTSINLTATAQTGSAKMWLASSKSGRQMLIHFAHLSPVHGSEVYQVWLLKKGAQPISAGVFTPNADGSAVFAALMPVGQYQLVAVTLEPKAIDVKPLGSIVFKGALKI